MSERTSRRALFGLFGGTRTVARDEADTARGGTSDDTSTTPRDVEVRDPSPWERRAQALAAGRPDSVARVLAFACLGGSPSFCSACVEHCPVPGALSLTGRAPRLDPDLCTGCGVCEQVCPAPSKAIQVLPRLHAAGGRVG